MRQSKLHIIRTLTFCMATLFFICLTGMTAQAEAMYIDVTKPPESVAGTSPYVGITTPRGYSIQLSADEEQGIVAATMDNYTVSGATPGTEITLKVYAKAGYRFKEWDVTGAAIEISDENTFTMPSSNVSIQAVFEENTDITTGAYNIKIEESEQGYAIAQLQDGTNPSVITANKDDKIKLFAIPKEGFRFKEWVAVFTKETTTESEDPKNPEDPENPDDPDNPDEHPVGENTPEGDDSSQSIEIQEGDVFEMPEGNVSITAVYEPLPTGTLTIDTNTKGNMVALVDNEKATSAKEGTQITLLPIPNEKGNYRLKSLKVTCGGTTIPVNNLTFTMPAGNVTIKSTFGENYTAVGNDTGIDTIAIQNALDTNPDGKDALTVYIPAGIYYIDKQLRIHSNTTLKLADGAVIKRADGVAHNMIMTSYFIKNADGSITYDSLSKGKYNLAQDIIIEGGTWDGGNLSLATEERNLFNIGHSSNIIIRNTTIKNCYGSHLIEFSGSKDCQVYNCTFTGFRKAGVVDSEAIQLDVCYSDWNTAYQSDKTVCQNITITNNMFINYPCAVGNHHQLSGYHNKNIVISNNIITCTDGKGVQGIHLFGFDNSTVTKNTITGYSVGVKTNNSFTYNLTYNNISNCSNYGIHSTGSSSGKIKYNTIQNTKNNGIYANANTKISALYKNQLNNVGTGKGNSGIWINGKGTTVKTFSSNTITGANYYGIHVNSGANVTKIYKNTVANVKKTGIYIKDAANKVKVKSNTIQNAKGAYAIKIDSKINKTKHTYSAKFTATPVQRKKGSVVFTGENLKKATIKAGSKTYSSKFKNKKANVNHKKIAKKLSTVTLTATDKYKNSIVKTVSVK